MTITDNKNGHHNTGTNESTECYRGFTGRDSWVNGCFLFLHLGKDVFNYRGWELDPNGKMTWHSDASMNRCLPPTA